MSILALEGFVGHDPHGDITPRGRLLNTGYDAKISRTATTSDPLSAVWSQARAARSLKVVVRIYEGPPPLDKLDYVWNIDGRLDARGGPASAPQNCHRPSSSPTSPQHRRVVRSAGGRT